MLEREASGWRRTVLSARKRLTLVLPPAGQEAHPAWLMLSALLEKPVIQSVEDTLTATPVPGHVSPVPCRPLPERRRWWQIPAEAIHGWERAASYSSLEQFFYNPYQWALNYPAQLKPSALLDLPGDFQLLGSLAHRAVEQLYRNPAALSWSVDRVRQWFDRECDRIIEEEGAVLLMRGSSGRPRGLSAAVSSLARRAARAPPRGRDAERASQRRRSRARPRSGCCAAAATYS